MSAMQFFRLSAAVLASTCVSAPAASPVFLHTLTALPDQTRNLQQQIAALKGSQESLEEDKHELPMSMQSLKRTRSSAEMKCMRERVVLKQKFKQTLERAEDTKVIAEQLQAQNMALRKEAVDAQRDEVDAKKRLNKLQHESAGDMFDQQHLKESVQQVLRKDWSASADLTNQSIPEMVAFAVSTCQAQNTMLHGVVSNLKTNLSATQEQLDAMIAESKSMPREQVRATEGVAQQLEVEGLKQQMTGLEKDNNHLAAQLWRTTSEVDALRQQLAQMTSARDELQQREVKPSDMRIEKPPAAQHEEVEALPRSEDPALGLVTPPVTQHEEVEALPQGTTPLVTQPEDAALGLVTPPITRPSVTPAEDAALGLVTPPVAQHHNIEETNGLDSDTKKTVENNMAAEPAAAEIAVTSETLGSPLSAWEVAPLA